MMHPMGVMLLLCIWPVITPAKEFCMGDAECANNEECSMFRTCQDPCTYMMCQPGGRCEGVNHVPICIFELGTDIDACTSNDGCGSDEACINGKCTDPCSFANCEDGCAVLDHEPLCGGIPVDDKNECESNTDCDSSKACLNGQCTDPCEFAFCEHGCTVMDHTFECIDESGHSSEEHD